MKHAQTRSQKTRDKILAAARILFLKNGFAETSTEQIAKEANVAKASIFAHFGDKTNLMIAVGHARILALLVDARALAQASDKLPLPAKLVQFYRPWLEFFTEHPQFANLYLSQSSFTKGKWSEQFVASCGEQENLIAHIISTYFDAASENKNLPEFYTRGAQAFFYQAVVYAISGWDVSNEQALQMLEKQLSVWFADIKA